MNIKKVISNIVVFSLIIIFVVGSSTFGAVDLSNNNEVPTDQYSLKYSEEYKVVQETLEISEWDEETSKMVTKNKEYEVVYVPVNTEIEFIPTVDLGATVCQMLEANGALEEDFMGLMWNIDGAPMLQNSVGANQTATTNLDGENNTYYLFTIQNFDNYKTEIMIKIVENIDEVTNTTDIVEEAPVKEHVNEDVIETKDPVVEVNETSESPDEWAKFEVDTAIHYDLVPTNLQNSYKENITRSEFCNLAITLIESIEDENISTIISERKLDVQENPFTDTDEAWVINAHRLGIVNGRGNGIFDPEGSISRQEAAVMLANTAKVLGTDISAVGINFNDNEKIASWANSGVKYVSENKIMGGIGNSMFSPMGSYTRQQAFVTILRLFEALESQTMNI